MKSLGGKNLSRALWVTFFLTIFAEGGFAQDIPPKSDPRKKQSDPNAMDASRTCPGIPWSGKSDCTMNQFYHANCVIVISIFAALENSAAASRKEIAMKIIEKEKGRSLKKEFTNEIDFKNYTSSNLRRIFEYGSGNKERIDELMRVRAGCILLNQEIFQKP